MRSNTGLFSTQVKQWDPEEVLGLINPDRGYVTCTAEAMTYGRRCRHAQNKIYAAARMLEDMATMDPLTVAKSDKLYAIARESVCYQHPSQANEVCRQWQDKLRAFAGSRKALRSPLGPCVNIKTEPDSEDEYAQWPASTSSQWAYTQADIDTMMDRMRKMQETIDNLQAQTKREEKEKKRKQEEEERLKREKAEKVRQQQEEEERIKRQKAEAARKLREEREKEERQEREKRERDRKERESREREERTKERARKRAQEDEARKKEWADSWKEYLEDWGYLKGKGCREAAPIEIPWPVKSGKWEDVTTENVKLFFKKAPPMPASAADAKQELYRLMSQENKRWHTDKIMQLFGPEILKGKHEKALDLVAKLVVELRKGAQKARKD